MATVFDIPFVRPRVQRIRQRDLDEVEQELSFARCDCTSYTYFALSMMFFSFGTVVTVLACGDPDGFILNNFGHMWLVGPIFICSGLMVAVKSMLYLRRKSVIQMLLSQRAIFMELTAQQAASCVLRTSSSAATLPPSYEALMPLPLSPGAGGELPPPTYEEAMCLIATGPSSSLKPDVHSSATGTASPTITLSSLPPPPTTTICTAPTDATATTTLLTVISETSSGSAGRQKP